MAISRKRLFKYSPVTIYYEQKVVVFNCKKHEFLRKIHQDETGAKLKRSKVNNKKEIIRSYKRCKSKSNHCLRQDFLRRGGEI